MDQIQNVFSENTLIKKLLEEYFPAESDLVGQRDIDRMIDHDVELSEFQFGSKLDYYEAYKALIEFISFIRTCAGLCKDTRDLTIPTNKQKYDKSIAMIIESREIRTITQGDKTEIIEKIETYYKMHE